MNWLSNKIEYFLFLLSVFALIIIFKGLNYASNDVVDVMSYARHLQDSSLFSKDFYVSNIASHLPNERIVFSGFLALFGKGLTFMPIVLHSIFTLIFLSGLYKILSLYINSKSLRWITILILLIPLYKFNLGGNELYYNMFISSFAAKTIGVWVIYFFLVNKKSYSFLLLIPATFFHPTVGLQLFILLCSGFVVDYFMHSNKPLKKNTKISLLLYVLIAGTYVYLLLTGVEQGGVDKDKYFEIFEFRNAHHFFPQYFPLKSYYVEIMIYVAGIYFMIIYKMDELLKLSFIIILGIIIYLIGIYGFKMTLILDSQWFKSTIWLELFSLIAIMKYFENEFGFIKFKAFDKITLSGMFFLNLVAVILIIGGNEYFKEKPYEFVYGLNLTPEEDIGVKIKEFSNKNDIFVYPMEFTGFKFYSERNAYVDFKSVVHRRDVLGEWYDRIKEVYGIDINTRRSGKDVFKAAKEKYKNIDNSQLLKLNEKGVDFIVQYNDVELNLPVVVKNEKYKVYKIVIKKN